jgi:hypothetical protein
VQSLVLVVMPWTNTVDVAVGVAVVVTVLVEGGAVMVEVRTMAGGVSVRVIVLAGNCVEVVVVTAGGVTVEVTSTTGGVMVATDITAAGVIVAVVVVLDGEGVVVTQEGGARMCEVYTAPGRVLVVVCVFGWTYLLQAFWMMSHADILTSGGISFRLQIGGEVLRFFAVPTCA